MGSFILRSTEFRAMVHSTFLTKRKTVLSWSMPQFTISSQNRSMETRPGIESTLMAPYQEM